MIKKTLDIQNGIKYNHVVPKSQKKPRNLQFVYKLFTGFDVIHDMILK